MVADSSTRLVMFDCDGTLVDSQHAIVSSMAAAFRAQGLKEPPALAVRRVVGLPLGEAISNLLPAGATGDLEDLTAGYKDAFNALRQRPDYEEPLYPGVGEVLDALAARGIPLGVAPGKSRRGLVATLESHGLLERFATLKTADDGPGKPNPDILNDAMAETGAIPDTTIMIGDTTYDIGMAVSARALSIGVAWGYHRTEELVAMGASRFADEFVDLPTVIAELWGDKP